MKYVIFITAGPIKMAWPVIFPDHLCHCDVQLAGATPVSAGFCTASGEAYGQATSLKNHDGTDLKSRPEDSQLLALFLSGIEAAMPMVAIEMADPDPKPAQGDSRLAELFDAMAPQTTQTPPLTVVEVVSPRQQSQNELCAFLNEHPQVFDAPYGVVPGTTKWGKGKVRTIAFGCARTLDAEITIWAPDNLTMSGQGAAFREFDPRKSYKSTGELISLLKSRFVH